MNPNHPPQPEPVFEVKFTVNMATGELRISGPDILDARTIYDYIFAETARMQTAKMLGNNNVVKDTGLILMKPH